MPLWMLPLLALLPSSHGASAQEILLSWNEFGFLPAAPESLARGPEQIDAGPGARFAVADPVRRQVVVFENDLPRYRIPVRAISDLLLLDQGVVVYDQPARQLHRYSFDGRLLGSARLPELAPAGIRLLRQGDELFGVDLFGNLHPLARLEGDSLSPCQSRGLVQPSTWVRWEKKSPSNESRLVTPDLVFDLPGALQASGQRLGDWLVMDTVVGDSPIRVERSALHIPTRALVVLPVASRLYAPRGDLALTPEGELLVLVPLTEGLQVMRISP